MFRWLTSLTLFIASVGHPSAAQEPAGVAPRPSPEEVQDPASRYVADLKSQSENVCGRNALYMLLRAYGHETAFDSVSECVPIGTYGSSLEELRRSARELGAETRIYQCDFEALKGRMPLPAIALLHEGGEADPLHDKKLHGHYVVVVGWSTRNGTEMVDALDGTFGTPRPFSRERFEAMWTGYVLTRSAESSPSQLWLWTTMHAGVWLVIGALIGIRGLSSTRSPVREAAGHG